MITAYIPQGIRFIEKLVKGDRICYFGERICYFGERICYFGVRICYFGERICYFRRFAFVTSAIAFATLATAFVTSANAFVTSANAFVTSANAFVTLVNAFVTLVNAFVTVDCIAVLGCIASQSKKGNKSVVPLRRLYILGVAELKYESGCRDVALLRLYKDFGIMENHFHTWNQQCHILCNRKQL